MLKHLQPVQSILAKQPMQAVYVQQQAQQLFMLIQKMYNNGGNTSVHVLTELHRVNTRAPSDGLQSAQ